MRSLLRYAGAVMAECSLGCSGRGDCHNGTCLCEIRYAGDSCAGPNMPYHACIGGVFLLVSFVCAVQLTVCIVSEYRRLKAPSLIKACKLTTQKLLYIVAFLASLIRGAYFVSPSAFEEGWATSLLSAYYPLLMSGSSLIVCFWAEVFHLRDIRWERPRFLSKSFLAFVSFNLISYSLLAAEVLTTNVADTPADKKLHYQHAFNLCYAVLLFITVIFFLIYGVEVYFKLRGEFVKETHVRTVTTPRAGAGDDDDVTDHLVKQGVQTDLLGGAINSRTVDLSQLHQSRLGLVSQALMLILIAGFLASETLSELWKSKVPVESRNWHDLLFRLAEIGVAIWFPCVLWNCMAPERLWLLNPRRLLARQLDDARLQDLVQPARWIRSRQLKWVRMTWHMAILVHTWTIWRVVGFLTQITKPEHLRSLEGATVDTICQQEKSIKDGVVLDNILKDTQNVETSSLVGSTGSARDCWICLDSERPEPLIQPCRCTGDVSSVHHACLSRWLVERSARANGLKCQVCNSPYVVQKTNSVDWERGFTPAHWARSVLALAVLGASAGLAWTLGRLYALPWVWLAAYGQLALVVYATIRYLSTNTVTAYQRAKVSSFKILTEPSSSSDQEPLATISKTVTVEIAASKTQLERALKGDATQK